MKCDLCGQEGVKLRKVIETYGKGIDLLIIEDIPMFSCPNCGESYFTAETLKYAALSGRVSNLQAGVGDLLGVKPILSAIHGHVAPSARARGRKRSLREVLARCADALAGRPANVAEMHANCPDEALAYADSVELAVSVHELQIVEIGPAIASLIGPGTLGLAGHPVPVH